MSGKILVVEDNKEISGLLTSFLEENGYEITQVFEGNTASSVIKRERFDLILMDLMLPFISGEELIKELRGFSDTPVIVLSAKSMLETRLEVLRIGADDYILKPFDLNEVLVRIEVVLRRSKSSAEQGKTLSYGGLTLFIEDNTVKYEEKSIALTAKELMLLKLFLEFPKKTFTKANLYESVWNDVYYYEDNTINVHVSNLRNKLKKATGKDCIETVWGIGYRLKEE